MIRYFEAFFRHRTVLLMPLVVALVAAVAYAGAQPRSYQSTASIWFDPTSSALASGQALSPDTSSSTHGLAVLKEYLATHDFDVKVGRQGPLAAYLEANPKAETAGIGALLRHVPLLGSSREPALSGPQLDDLIVATVARDVTLAATGPQVLTVTVTSPSAAVATGTAAALVQQFSAQLVADRTAQASAAVDYWTARMGDATRAVAVADRQLSEYEVGHPRSSVAGAVPDQSLITLSQADTAERQRLAQAADKLQQAVTDRGHVSTDSGTRVVDPPSQPSAALDATKKVAYAAFGGLFVGLLTIACAVAVLVGVDRTARRPVELETALNLRVLASIPLSRSRPARAPSRSKSATPAWRSGRTRTKAAAAPAFGASQAPGPTPGSQGPTPGSQGPTPGPQGLPPAPPRPARSRLPRAAGAGRAAPAPAGTAPRPPLPASWQKPAAAARPAPAAPAAASMRTELAATASAAAGSASGTTVPAIGHTPGVSVSRTIVRGRAVPIVHYGTVPQPRVAEQVSGSPASPATSQPPDGSPPATSDHV